MTKNYGNAYEGIKKNSINVIKKVGGSNNQVVTIPPLPDSFNKGNAHLLKNYINALKQYKDEYDAYTQAGLQVTEALTVAAHAYDGANSFYVDVMGATT
jgi:hypothetical protein